MSGDAIVQRRDLGDEDLDGVATNSNSDEPSGAKQLQTTAASSSTTPIVIPQPGTLSLSSFFSRPSQPKPNQV